MLVFLKALLIWGVIIAIVAIVVLVLYRTNITQKLFQESENTHHKNSDDFEEMHK